MNRPHSRLLAALAVALAGAGCATVAAPPAGTTAPPPALAPAAKERIGQKIWRNECGGTVAGLTTWNAGENFPSLGIGHTIWYPAGKRERFEETFPALVAFMRARGAAGPAWLTPATPCPWPDRASFQREFESPRARELRAWLAATVGVQTDFLIARQQAALPKMLAACEPAAREVVWQRYQALAATPEGRFVLIDYVNFKGEGTNPGERYRGAGWGLLQVLQEMHGRPAGSAAVAEFARAADRRLTLRVKNSPPERGEGRWLQGWRNRLAGYLQPL
jgi:hypothetical protein